MSFMKLLEGNKGLKSHLLSYFAPFVMTVLKLAPKRIYKTLWVVISDIRHKGTLRYSLGTGEIEGI